MAKKPLKPIETSFRPNDDSDQAIDDRFQAVQTQQAQDFVATAAFKGGGRKKPKEKKIRITVDLPPAMHAKLKMLANRDNSSIAAQGFAAIEEWLEREENKIHYVDHVARKID